MQHNRDYAATIATIATIDRERPDVLLLMETDQPWAKALAPVLARYPHRLLRPIDNTYGLIFATTLPVDQARTKNITDQNTPTVYARLRTRGGQPFDYIGLHPRPPIAGEDTNLRDRKIEHAALRIAGAKVPAMAMGDFNDVAWSRTTQLFKRVGGYLDPRIGRGSYPSFPAQYAAVGWPLDQLFVSKAFTSGRCGYWQTSAPIIGRSPRTCAWRR
nr:endonuclease/exonuclease/phosphatase family protein [Sphingomonas sp. CROZ-RG-20F-R02-07]